MAEFALPKNSKVQKGKIHPAPENASNTKTFNIYRWSPDDDDNPRMDTYTVDLDGAGCPDQDQGRNRHHPDIPAVLP
jgi:succinate dehydrogenase / fumarate reductase iron-sulfur subunit